MAVMDRIQAYLAKTSGYIFYGLLAYVPLHILLSTWIGTTLGYLEFFKIAKDIALLVGFSAAVFLSYRQAWFARFLRWPLISLIIAYSVYSLLTTLVLQVQADAELLSLLYNLRFLIFFMYAALLARLFDLRTLLRRSLTIVLSVGGLVALFGVVQYVALPDDLLTRFGYSRENGVLPAFFIDNKPDLERVMSTVRDPNSLGSYLLIIGSLFVALLTRSRQTKWRVIAAVGLGLSLACLLLTFSRSAWLGALAATLVFVGAYAYRQQWHKSMRHRTILSLCLVLASISVITVVATKESYFVQNVIFHADKSTVLEDPNELRVRFWQEAVVDSQAQPFGHGLGTAGLASIRNTEQGTVLTENYYLQILYEVGVVGLVLFLVILVFVGYLLLRTFMTRDSLFALALFAACVGLLLANFLVHIWANEAVAYTFWGLAGLMLAHIFGSPPQK